MIRLSVSEAAKFFGIDAKTIRRAIAAREINYVVVRGRYKIDFDNLLKWSQVRPTVKNKLEKNGVGQYVDKWKISAPLFSPNSKRLKKKEEENN